MMTARSTPAANAVSVSQEMLDPAFRLQLRTALAEGLTIERLTVRRMRRRPGSRHVFSCQISVGDHYTGTQRSIQLIGKRDTKRGAGKAAREFEAMRLLWDAGFGVDERLRIPRPVQHFPELQLILQGRARGSKLRTHCGKGTDASVGYSRLAGLWLAKLHNLEVSPKQLCTYVDEAASLGVFVGALCADLPKLAAELQQRGAIIGHRFANFQGAPAAMVHGDFHPDHIFVEKDYITVIDFERMSVGDPARDLGSFIAHMRTMACCSGRALDAANCEINAFLRSYLSAIPVTQAFAIAPRIATYVALSSMEALYYVASVLKVTDSSRIAMYVKRVRDSELFASKPAASAFDAPAASVLAEGFVAEEA